MEISATAKCRRKGSGVPRRLAITGASSGLGRALAFNYAAPGVTIGLVGRDAGRLEDTAQACREAGAACRTGVVDVSDCAALAAWLANFQAQEPLDLLIANAGVCEGPQDARSLDGGVVAARVIRINLLGAVGAVEAVAPAMIARGAGQIALISSTAAYRGLPYMPAYAASKAGVRIYGEAVRARLRPLGVAVTVVTPSFFDSPMTDRFHGPKPQMVSTAEAVARIRRGLDRRQARVVFPRRVGALMQVLDLLPGNWGDGLVESKGVRIADQGLERTG